ncbi:unnamed protein product [Cunninghamella blakesleeana]
MICLILISYYNLFLSLFFSSSSFLHSFFLHVFYFFLLKRKKKMKSILLFTTLTTLAITTTIADVPELNDMYLHHHPSQAKKLAMAAAGLDYQQEPPIYQPEPINEYGRVTAGGRNDYYVKERYDRNDPYDPISRSPYTYDNQYRGRPWKAAFQEGKGDDEKMNIQPYPYNNDYSYNPYYNHLPPPPPSSSPNDNGYHPKNQYAENRGPVIDGNNHNNNNDYYYNYRKQNEESYPQGEGRSDRGPVIGGSNDAPIKYTANGGIDWSNPIFQGKVQVDRGYDDSQYDPSRNLKMASSVDPGEGYFTGKGLYFDVSQRQNSCGISVTNYDLVGALNSKQFGEKNQNNPNCGKEVIVTGPTGKEVQIKIVDGCDTCSEGDIDFSPAAFEKISEFSHGQSSIKWKFA